MMRRDQAAVRAGEGEKEHHDVPRAAWWQLPAVRRAAVKLCVL
ncbi:MAG: hypothetical protein ACI8RZ_006274, partial [Myxococcota bacterium]